MHALLCAEPPCVLGREEMLTLLLPMENRWKELGEKLGCGEDLLDEIFTNNETSRECLRNVADVFHLRKTKADLASTLREMGEIELAVALRTDHKQGDSLSNSLLIGVHCVKFLCSGVVTSWPTDNVTLPGFSVN